MALNDEVEGLQRTIELWVEKKNRLRDAIVIEADTVARFKYETQLSEVEKELEERKEELAHKKAARQAAYDQEVLARKSSDMATVNCNRKIILKRFWRAFSEKQENSISCQHYAMVHQEYGQSESLLRRIITDFKDKQERFGSKVKYTNFNDIKPWDVDIDIDEGVDDILFEIRKKFYNTFGTKEKSLQAFCDNIGRKHPPLKDHHFVFAHYRIKAHAQAFTIELPQAIEEFITQFCNLNPDTKPCFLFFYIFELKGQQEQKPGKLRFPLFKKKNQKIPLDRDIYELLKTLANKQKDVLTLLPPLRFISRDDIDDWYRKYVDNQLDREELVDAMVNKLGKGTEWSMAAVEKLLKEEVQKFRKAV